MNSSILSSQPLLNMLILLMIILALVVEILLIIIFIKNLNTRRRSSVIGKGGKPEEKTSTSDESRPPENNEINESNKELVQKLCGGIEKINTDFINMATQIMDSIKNTLIYRELGNELKNNLENINNILNDEIKPSVEIIKTHITSLDKLVLRAILTTYYSVGKRLAFILLQLISSEENLPKDVEKLVSELNEQAKFLVGKSGDLWTLALKVEIYTILKTLSAGDQTTSEKPLLGLIDRNALSKLEESLKGDLEKACNTKIKKLDANELGKLLLSDCSGDSGDNSTGLGGSMPSGSSNP